MQHPGDRSTRFPQPIIQIDLSMRRMGMFPAIQPPRGPPIDADVGDEGGGQITLRFTGGDQAPEHRRHHRKRIYGSEGE